LLIRTLLTTYWVVGYIQPWLTVLWLDRFCSFLGSRSPLSKRRFAQHLAPTATFPPLRAAIQLNGGFTSGRFSSTTTSICRCLADLGGHHRTRALALCRLANSDTNSLLEPWVSVQPAILRLPYPSDESPCQSSCAQPYPKQGCAWALLAWPVLSAAQDSFLFVPPHTLRVITANNLGRRRYTSRQLYRQFKQFIYFVAKHNKHVSTTIRRASTRHATSPVWHARDSSRRNGCHCCCVGFKLSLHAFGSKHASNLTADGRRL
jgi:hypothetical protein